MELTKNNIVNRINRLVINYKVTWDEIVDDLDMAIDEINSYMSTKYPKVSSILNEYTSNEKTYSFRAGGNDVPFFPEKYFTSIVIPYVAAQILTRDEEFSMIHSKFMSQYQENLFIMARDEMNNIPYQFISAPKGVYFANPDPIFKQNPEKYFNEKVFMETPEIRVSYSWGNFKSLLPFGVQSFVEKPLPKDPNAYETGFQYMPVMMAGDNFSTMIVNYEQKVLGIFLGWSLKDNNDPSGIIQNPIRIYEDTTFYAVFDLDVVGIEYRGNGGTIHNWRPTYMTKADVISNITPMGGTAFRKGFRFVGFLREQENLLLTQADPFEEENDVHPEPNISFIAQWYRMIYIITYIGAKGNFNPIRRNYTFGAEFNLDLPIQSESEPDEFIGWWDNPQFLGSPISKINESDYGDKTFYAKYNEEKYRVRWLREDDSIIKEEFLTKGTFLTEPSNITKGNAWIGGLFFRFDYIGFVNEYNEFFQPGITKAQRNINLKVVFSQPIPVLTDVVVQYKTNENEEIVDKQIILPKKQVGTNVDIGTDIIGYLINENLSTYQNEDEVEEFIESVSFIINGTPQVENKMSFGDSFIITEKITYQLYAWYGQTFRTVTFKNKIYSGGQYIVGSLETQEKFIDNSSKMVVENKGATNLDILFEVTLMNGTKEYLQGFKVLSIEGIESDMPQNITQDLTLVPFYGPVMNESFVRRLTLVGMPTKESETIKETKVLTYRIGKEVSLLEIKEETLSNDYKFLRIDKFFSNSINEILVDEITSNTIKLNNNRTIYIQTSIKKLYSVLYYASNGTTIIKSIDLFPFQFAEGAIQFNTLTNQPQGTIISHLGARYKHKGWNTTEGAIINELFVSLLENRGTDLKLYPIFVRLGDFIVNYEFVGHNSAPILTNYTLESTRMTSNKKRIDYEEYKDKLNSNFTLFQSYNSFIQDLNAQSDLIPGTEIQPQQIGYNLHGYRVDGSSIIEGVNIIIPLPDSTTIEGIDKQINLTLVLSRNTNYVHLLIGEDSKPNNSLSSPEISFHTGTQSFQRNKFVTKGLTFSQLISSGEIPSLWPYNGESLNYCYWSQSQPYEVNDVVLSAQVLQDIKIYIKDTVNGLQQFKIFYIETTGMSSFNILKTINVFSNQLATYGSVWVFDINSHKPTDPTKEGFLFKGYSHENSNGSVAANLGISTARTIDVYFTAVYNPLGKIYVNYKVQAETGDLFTNYDLTEDYPGTNKTKFSFTKEYNHNQRQIHVIPVSTLKNELIQAIDAISLNQRARIGYEVVKVRLEYPYVMTPALNTSYETTTSNFSLDLRIPLNELDNKNVTLTLTLIQRLVTGYIRAEVLEKSLPGELETIITGNALKFRKFFIAFGETFSSVKNDFQNNYANSPLPDLEKPYYHSYVGSGFLALTSHTFNSSSPNPTRITIRDDINPEEL